MRQSDYLLKRLEKSHFRSSFHLSQKDKAYCYDKGRATIERHARDFIAQRIAPAIIKNDGKQTPMKNHPVFIAQHATATCCRQCLHKWHHIVPGVELSVSQQEYIVEIIMKWIEKELNDQDSW